MTGLERIKKWNILFKTFGTMLDCSRNAVMTAESVRRWIDLTAKLGCNTLHLYMEDTYEVDGQPYFGHLRDGTARRN